MRRERSQRKSAQPAASAPHAAPAGGRLSRSRPKREVHTAPMTCQEESSCPHQVSRAASSAWPKPAKTKKRIIMVMRATGFHFTQAETARAKRERKRIHAQLPRKRP